MSPEAEIERLAAIARQLDRAGRWQEAEKMREELAELLSTGKADR